MFLQIIRLRFRFFLIPYLYQSVVIKKIMKKSDKIPFVWEAANLYFLMTDRFNKGNAEKEIYFNRNKPSEKLRGFEGGDIKGIIHKIDDGYFEALGINAIWLTPIVEQIHDVVNDGIGFNYGYHGYWTRDWSAVERRSSRRSPRVERSTSARCAASWTGSSTKASTSSSRAAPPAKRRR